jgi:hypothetical protein
MKSHLSLIKKEPSERTDLYKNSSIHVGIIMGWAALLNMLPRIASNMPLRNLLSSDAEFYVNFMQIYLDPGVFALDQMFRQVVYPIGTRLILQNLTYIADLLRIDLFQWSIILSFINLALFLLGLYWLLRQSLKSKLFAFVITLFSVIPVHVLGGTTYGFQALGFLVRDLALGLSMYVLLLYFLAINRKKLGLLQLCFLIMGILANGYPLLFFHLFAVLLFAELIRKGKLTISVFIYTGLFLAASSPAWLDMFINYSPATSIDMDLLRIRLGYMMASPLFSALTQYLRRFFLYFLFILVIYWPIRRWASENEKQILEPWLVIAASSFIIAVVGVIIETFTPYAKYVISRTSIWFTLSAMVITCLGLRIVIRRFFPKHVVWLTIVATSLIFAGQSNLPTVYRYLRDGYNNREHRLAFHKAVSEFKTISDPDDLVIAPSEEMNDIAASLRTYSLRPVYVSYKDGGIVVLDGELARRWYNRYQESQNILESRDARLLLDFMAQEGIDFAFVPNDYYTITESALVGHIATQTDQYLIIKKDLIDTSTGSP